MTTTEKLNAIADKCRANLALAANRTPGKWAFSPDYGDERNQPVHTDEDKPWFLMQETYGSPEQKHNAAFVAACACAAEAGWRTTLAAIESVSLVNRGASPSLTQREERLITAILAAWEGLL